MSKGKSISKKNKSTKKEISSSNMDFNKNNQFFYLLTTIALVFLVYSFSLFRPWLPFDERLFYQEVLFPIPKTFNEIFEVISAFVLSCHVESTNTFFSNCLTIRSAPMAWTILTFLLFFFKTNPLAYHMFLLTIHLINTALIWFIFFALYKIFTFLPNKKESNTNNPSYLIVSIFTLLWALHSANTEAILLTTNWNALLSFTFCFAFLLYEISLVDLESFKVSKVKLILIAILFLFTTSLIEQVYTFPIIIFFTCLALSYIKLHNFKTAISIATKLALPYFIGLFLYLLFHLESFFTLNLQATVPKSQAFYIFFERNLWLSPQIFIHLMKLLCFPKTLSLYQSDLTLHSNTLIEPSSIFSTFIYLAFIILPISLLFILKNNSLKSICILIYAFFFSLFPFLHILLPTYCLSADRYCYFPSFFLLLLVLTAVFVLIPEMNTKKAKTVIVILSSVLILLTARTIIRINEWNNPYLLYKASAEAEKLPLYKAHKLIVFSSYLSKLGKDSEVNASLEKSLKLLARSTQELKQLKLKYPKQPITLKQYGLDASSLILKNAYLISTVKYDNYREPAKDILSFYEPYINKYLKLAFVNQIAFYAEILSASGQDEKAKSILEYGLKRFPYSSALLLSLSEYYLQKKELDKAYPVIKQAYKQFPNDPVAINKFYRYYELKNDLPNQAKFAYLLGLRNHDAQSYQRAVQIYLALRYLKDAKLALKKLIRLTGETPLTILFTTSYLDLAGSRDKILPLLNKAYALSKSQGKSENLQVTKSILASLIASNLYSGKRDNAEIFLKELENLGNLTTEDLKQIQELKKRVRQDRTS